MLGLNVDVRLGDMLDLMKKYNDLDPKPIRSPFYTNEFVQ